MPGAPPDAHLFDTGKEVGVEQAYLFVQNAFVPNVTKLWNIRSCIGADSRLLSLFDVSSVYTFAEHVCVVLNNGFRYS